MNAKTEGAILTDISGIAERTAEKLALEGVTTVQQLRDLSEDDLDKLDAKLGLMGKPRLLKWHEQAERLLALETPVEANAKVPESDKDRTIAELSAKLAQLNEVVSNTSAGPRLRRRLNRCRDFGEIFGLHLNSDKQPTGAAYSQWRDGEEVFFNHVGLEIKEGELAGNIDGSDAEPEYQPRDLLDFHPLNWLDDKVEYPDFDFVRRAIQSRFGRNAKTVRAAKALLHEQLRSNH